LIRDSDVSYRSADTNVFADWNKIFKKFAEASLGNPVNLARGIGSVVAAANPTTAWVSSVFAVISAIGEDSEEKKDRQNKAAVRQSEQSEQVKDADDETHALTILRHLERPARSLDLHLSAKDGHPDWDGLWGKSSYTGGDQPWSIKMIETEITGISSEHAVDSSAARLGADDLVRALAGVWLFFGILLDNQLTTRLSSLCKTSEISKTTITAWRKPKSRARL
jgi:hypothetical protein